MTSTPELLSCADDLTPDRLSELLGGTVRAVTVERIGTGQIGTCHRAVLSGEDVPVSVIVKLPIADPGTRRMLAGAYRGEVHFYTDIAATVAVRTPVCHHAALGDDGEFTLLLEDAAPAAPGDQLTGCTVEQAHDAVRNLAGLHGPRWCDESLHELDFLTPTDAAQARLLAELYGPAIETFADDLGDLVSAEDHALLRACAEVTERWILARSQRFALLHGDYRLDNLLFPPDGAAGVTAVDWQTLTVGLPARDLAYFVATSLPPEVRRAHERDLVATYHRALLGHGVVGYSFEQCWDDYRFALLQGPLVAVFGCAYGVRTPRGDRMFATMVARSCAAIRDLDGLTVVTADVDGDDARVM
ncbi:ecdysteroid 22-kinase family protein [Rhodococcus sp. Z13]|uniref:Ecdysteroid 22-kinase family protein n=1 Tax=Rhodococcus sacchari TaxID=2962047 RepID=A0ACD4DI20_9NOCA|nr:ecdysteroid 22-kinase family protein [Rhodococcus sp. Z13]UYP19623.1 ecdysteroid 22-kinase family protein [Rhodococcus sp. Z13]